MPGLDPGTYVLVPAGAEGVGGRIKSGHDDVRGSVDT
ncbi:MAG: hypothetical protein K0S56_3308 [Microvirga sp.]|nr:hypothetical protein [Microvirga sp.]